MKKLDPNFAYLPDMYQDDYFPNFLVDKVKVEIEKVVSFLEEESHTTEEIQKRFDAMTIPIAIESGNRAWSFASLNSDYNCRFIYVHLRDRYLLVFEDKDTIEYTPTLFLM